MQYNDEPERTIAWQLREKGVKGRSKGREIWGSGFLQNSSPIHRYLLYCML
jgi:hypothetical protein